MVSPPALVTSFGMLSTPADSPFFSATYISFGRIRIYFSSGICGQSSSVESPSVS